MAESAIRWNSPDRRTSLSTAVTRCVPRFVAATAWISSRMTVARPSSIKRPFGDDRMRFRLSGVVMRTSGGWASILRLSEEGVSPLLVRTLISGKWLPAREKKSPRPASGVRRFLWMSLLSAFNGETYRMRTFPAAQAPVTSLSIPQRNAASVLPVPVGALTRTCAPAAISGHAFCWTSVGRPTACRNHSATRG